MNEAIQRGLSRGNEPSTEEIKPFVVKPHACGLMPGIDPLKINQLVDELELEAFAWHHSSEGDRA